MTCTHKHGEGEHHHEDDDHVHGEHSQTEVMLTDLFHIIHYCGILLNKSAPEDDDCTPFEEFNKYAKTEMVAEHEGGPMQEITYVDADDIPKILFAIFVG